MLVPVVFMGNVQCGVEVGGKLTVNKSHLASPAQNAGVAVPCLMVWFYSVNQLMT